MVYSILFDKYLLNKCYLIVRVKEINSEGYDNRNK